jgi:selenophosphate synthetase-related protein
MDYNELLFAAQIRSRAESMRQFAQSNYKKENPEADMVTWTKSNPDTGFILAAHKEITNIAKLLRENQAGS